MKHSIQAITLFLVALMVGAAHAGPISLGGRATSNDIIVGTLADANNPVEMATAPEYTRLAVLRQRTAKVLVGLSEQPGVTKPQLQTAIQMAMAIQSSADSARELLNGLAGTKTLDQKVSDTLTAARETIQRGEILYDNLRGMLK